MSHAALQLKAYYPAKDVTRRCKNEEEPDKERWAKYVIRVFAYTGEKFYMFSIL